MLQNLQKDLQANPGAHSFDEVLLFFNFISSGVELFGFSHLTSLSFEIR
jgi:hypothetical protein